MMKFWLLKSEPDVYSWNDLKKEKNLKTSWEGIRNYQARNFIRDEMSPGDLAFFYHSNIKPAAIVGIVEIVSKPCVDHFVFEKEHRYFDPKSNPQNPVWYMVDVKAHQEFQEPITIDRIKTIPELEQMVLLNNSRLSVQPVKEDEWKIILSLAPTKSI
jgi:predicted RNA-binding protein with PUA-like domain